MRVKKIHHANVNQKKAKAMILLSDKIDFKAEKINRGKEKHYIMIKRSIHQEVIAILNMYAENNRTVQYVKQKLIELKGEIHKPPIIVRDLNTLSQ